MYHHRLIQFAVVFHPCLLETSVAETEMTMEIMIADVSLLITDDTTNADVMNPLTTDIIMTVAANLVLLIITTMTAVANLMIIMKISADVMTGLNQETADNLYYCSPLKRAVFYYYLTLYPPSRGIIAPVMYAEASDAR